MKPEKKERSQKPKILDIQDQEAMGNLAESMIEEFGRTSSVEEEPFEIYAAQLKARLIQDPKTFRNRFIRGYQALLEELYYPQK